MVTIRSSSNTDNYLYKSFRLQSVNTAKDLRRAAHPFVSFAVLAGGIVVALLLFVTHRIVTDQTSVLSLYEGEHTEL